MRTPLGLALVLLGGCSIAGESDEREAADREGRPFGTPFERRELPPLPERASRADVLQRAFLANADLERAYFAWRAALERVPQEAAPDQPVLSFERMFTKERMSSWDRTTLGVSQMVPYPGKLGDRGRIALQEAIAARRRFEDAKFMLQAEVIDAVESLVLTDRETAIARENLELLRQFVDVTRTLVSAGKARQVDLSKAELEADAAENDLKTVEARRSSELARVNRWLSRPPDSALAPLAADRPPSLPASDAGVLELAAERNPELAALAAEVKGREEALELARKAWLPDFSFSFEIQGSIERMLGAMLTLPLQVGRIRAGIDEANAGLRAAQAAVRARRDDLKAQVVLNLYVTRDADRRLQFLESKLLSKAKEIVETVRETYGTGGASFLELLDAQRALLQLRLETARLDAMRRSALAKLEALCAVDFGALAPEEKK